MTRSLPIVTGVRPSRGPNATHDQSESYSLARLGGRLCELSGHTGSAVLSFAFGLVLDAQFHTEPTSWITSSHHSFFPPDAAVTGIDLNALVVIRLEGAQKRISASKRPVRRRSYASRAARAAEHLVRSGAFGLIVLDLGTEGTLSMATQTRLAGLAKAHNTLILCLTDKAEDTASIGSLISWRAHTNKIRVGPGLFQCTAEVSKDKRRGPGWSHTEVHRGPPGLY